MRSVRLLVQFLVPALWPLLAAADVHWLCGQSEDLTRIVCVADIDDGHEVDAKPAPVTAVVRGTRFPLVPHRIYTVDMWAPATDEAEVEVLARATICYRSPGCRMTFSAPRWSPDFRRVAALSP